MGYVLLRETNSVCIAEKRMEKKTMPDRVQSEYRKGRKNLIFATLISIPGPLLLVLSMSAGSSSTQIADLLRRSCEFLTIFLAWMVYELTLRSSTSQAVRTRLEKFIQYFTGASMCVSGAVMLYVAVAEFGGESGDIIPSLILAVIGAVINARLYLNYRALNHAVLSIQAKLHRVKMLLDCGLVVILLVWLLSPNAAVQQYADAVGTGCISLYLIWSGIRALRDRKKENNCEEDQ